MSLLSDRDIEKAMAAGQIGIAPFDRALLQPASIDVRLGDEFRVFPRDWRDRHGVIDPRVEEPTALVTVPAGVPFVLGPGQFVLGSTVETLSLDDSIAARYEGKSSIGRLGLLSHCTAAFVDPSFSGSITLELHNLMQRPLRLWPGMKIGQLCFFDLTSRARVPYGRAGNHYQGQRGPTPSRAFAQFGDPA